MKTYEENLIYATNALQKITSESTEKGKTPSFSTTSEYEFNDKNSAGLIFEYSRTKRNTFSDAFAENFTDNTYKDGYTKTQKLDGLNQNLGSNLFYKYYDKEKNKILDLNAGINYNSVEDTNNHLINSTLSAFPTGTVSYTHLTDTASFEVDKFKNLLAAYFYLKIESQETLNFIKKLLKFFVTFDSLTSKTIIMKKIILAMGLSSLALLSCKKDDEETAINNLVGTWKPTKSVVYLSLIHI